MSVEISQELAERMVATIRQVVSAYDWVEGPNQWLREARAIVAELPVPVDPDMIAAREVVCGYHHDQYHESAWHQQQAILVRDGSRDQMLDVQAAYHGIKRGRELAAQS